MKQGWQGQQRSGRDCLLAFVNRLLTPCWFSSFRRFVRTDGEVGPAGYTYWDTEDDKI